jgi:putative heme-binding domain-containing protein
LLEKRVPELAPLLLDLLSDPALRRLALRGLAYARHDDAPRRILAHYGDFSAEEKQEAVATLASRKEYALALLDAMARQQVPRTDLSAYSARQLHSLGEPQVRERLRQVWGEVRDAAPEKQQQIARFKALLSPTALSRADLSNGRVIYSKTCQQCHMLFGEGGKIGPDLTGANRSNLDYLLSNLLDPSAEIGQDYRMALVTTTDGRVLTGMIVERTAARLVLQTATERMVLSAGDVDSVRASPLSMMPEGQLDSLTREQVRDLVGYLAAKQQVALPAP